MAVGEAVGELIASWSGLPVGWRVLLLAALPVTELRAALPLGLVWGLSPLAAFLWSIAGNFIPVLPLLAGLGVAYRRLAQRPPLARPLARLAAFGDRHCRQVGRYGLPGLTLLVAVPLPGTGVWTGCLVAALLRLRLWPAAAAITLGEVVAGIIVALAAGGVAAAVRLDGGAWLLIPLAAAALLVLLTRGRP